MTDLKQQEKRERLALAQGWVQSMMYENSREVPIWKLGENVIRRQAPDPYTRADDWLALAEWARTQVWFMAIRIGNVGVAVDHGFPRKEAAAQGPLLQAFPNAIVAALQSLKEKGE